MYTGNLFMHVTGTFAANVAQWYQQLANLLLVRSTYNVPVWAQQVGVNSIDDPQGLYLDHMLGALNAAGVPWEYWQYRDATQADGYGALYQDGSGGWITKDAYLAKITSYMKA